MTARRVPGGVRGLRRVAAAHLAAWALAGCGAEPATLSEPHAAAIRDSVAAALASFREIGAGDEPSAVGGFYSTSPSFRFYENGELRYRSAGEVRAALESLPAGMRIATEYRETEIEPLAPGVALVRSLFESTMTTDTSPTAGDGRSATAASDSGAADGRSAAGDASPAATGAGRAAEGAAIGTNATDETGGDGSREGASFTFGGAVTLLWVHEPDGWRIISGHSSSPVPRGG